MKFLKKWFFRLILCGIVLIIIIGVIAYIANRSTIPPSVESAPWAIQTYSNDELKIPSRIYLAETVEIVDGMAIATNYWRYDGKRYKRDRGDIVFPEELYGNIKITRRGEQ